MDSSYYVSTRKKVLDFLLGFVGTLGMAGVLVLLSSSVRSSSVTGIWMLGGAVWIVGVILLFGSGRRFIAIGGLCTLLIPLLAVGACFVALFTGGIKF